MQRYVIPGGVLQMRMGVARGAGEFQEDYQISAHQGHGFGKPIGVLQELRQVVEEEGDFWVVGSNRGVRLLAEARVRRTRLGCPARSSRLEIIATITCGRPVWS